MVVLLVVLGSIGRRRAWPQACDHGASRFQRTDDGPAWSSQALVVLANLGRPRRPSGAAVARAEPILPNPAVASAQLADVVDQPVATADLADLRRLQRAACPVRGARPRRSRTAPARPANHRSRRSRRGPPTCVRRSGHVRTRRTSPADSSASVPPATTSRTPRKQTPGRHPRRPTPTSTQRGRARCDQVDRAWQRRRRLSACGQWNRATRPTPGGSAPRRTLRRPRTPRGSSTPSHAQYLSHTAR